MFRARRVLRLFITVAFLLLAGLGLTVLTTGTGNALDGTPGPTDNTSSLLILLPFFQGQAPQPTPTPTATPTNTPAATPTPTNTPQATPIPPDLQVLPNHTHYVDNIDHLYIVGEIRNNTPNHLDLKTIAVNVFDYSGRLLDTRSTYLSLDDLPPGDTTCFQLSMPEPDGWSYYEFEPLTNFSIGQPNPNLTIFNDSGSSNSDFSLYEIVGQVRNDDATRVEFVTVVGTLYNSSGAVIGCKSASVNSRDLEPGQTSSFKLTYWGNVYADAQTYRLQVDGIR